MADIELVLFTSYVDGSRVVFSDGSDAFFNTHRLYLNPKTDADKVKELRAAIARGANFFEGELPSEVAIVPPTDTEGMAQANTGTQTETVQKLQLAAAKANSPLTLNG